MIGHMDEAAARPLSVCSFPTGACVGGGRWVRGVFIRGGSATKTQSSKIWSTSLKYTLRGFSCLRQQ